MRNLSENIVILRYEKFACSKIVTKIELSKSSSRETQRFIDNKFDQHSISGKPFILHIIFIKAAKQNYYS